MDPGPTSTSVFIALGAPATTRLKRQHGESKNSATEEGAAKKSALYSCVLALLIALKKALLLDTVVMFLFSLSFPLGRREVLERRELI